ncbi:MAG: glycosyltransferase family 9 protein [Bacteroidales bacterium]|nr:glycosyltransferase family 9 protein [Bacteroidales bacterium]
MVKFLIVRFSSIGDIVLTTPVIRCLNEQVEDSEIHFLTKKKFVPILESNPYIAQLHSLDNNFSILIKQLKNEQFDYIIDLHRNLRTLRLKTSLHRISFSFKKLNLRKWLAVNFKINRLPDIHIVDRYFDTLKIFSVINDNKGLDYFIPANEEVNPEDLSKDLLPGYVVIIVGGGHNTKQIPVEKLTEIINELKKPVVLIGGKEDINKADKITADIRKSLTNLTGKLSVNQSASVIRQAQVILTPDTGMMHIAAAFQKRIISVWGNTIPEFGMPAYQPVENSAIFEVNNLSCRPCSKIGYKKCPKKHFKCMYDQDYDLIINLLNE